MIRNSIIILFILLSCSNEKPVVKAIPENIGRMPDQICKDFSMKFIDSMKLKAFLKSPQARIFSKERNTYLDSSVFVEFYSAKSNKRDGYLEADSALIDDNLSNMYAYGNVFVKSDSSGTTLKTNSLEWNQKKRKLYSNDYVEVNSPYEFITGYGFESDENLQNYVIYKVSGKRK